MKLQTTCSNKKTRISTRVNQWTKYPPKLTQNKNSTKLFTKTTIIMSLLSNKIEIEYTWIWETSMLNCHPLFWERINPSLIRSLKINMRTMTSSIRKILDSTRIIRKIHKTLIVNLKESRICNSHPFIQGKAENWFQSTQNNF